MDLDNTNVLSIATTAGSAAFATKILVDVLTMGWPTRPTYVAPVAAILLGVACTFLQLLASTATITIQLSADAVLLGIGVGGMAIGITAAHNSAEARRRAVSPAKVSARKKKGV